MQANTPPISMYHVIQVGMNTELLRRLDELRRIYPEAANRRDIINALIREAHAKLPPGNVPLGGVHEQPMG